MQNFGVKRIAASMMKLSLCVCSQGNALLEIQREERERLKVQRLLKKEEERKKAEEEERRKRAEEAAARAAEEDKGTEEDKAAAREKRVEEVRWRYD